jgi:hypothetical protein
MIYELDISLLEAIEGNNVQALNFLSGLVDGRRRGKLSILTSKKICISIINCQYIEDSIKAIFKKENHDLTFTKGVLDQVERRLVCFHSNFNAQIREIPSSCLFDVAEYSPDDERFNSIFDQVKLYVEDLLSDGKVFKVINSYFTKEISIDRNFKVNFEMLHGGGHRIIELYRNAEYDKRNVFAIVDSDKKSPEYSLGKTSRELKAAFQELDLQYNLFVGRFHEIENLIPLSIYQSIANPTQITALNFLEYCTALSPESYLYYDFKNSFTFETVFGTDDEFSSYWRPKFEGSDCVQLSQTINRGVAKNKLLNKLSVIVRPCITELEENVPKNLANPELSVEWNNIGKWLYEVGICSKAISI